jgi:amino acid adenylation domain-containing protein
MNGTALDDTAVTIVFRAFHGVMDGRGALAWAGDVFRALRGEEPAGAPSRATDYSLLRRYGAVGRHGAVGRYGTGRRRPALTPTWSSPLRRDGPQRWSRRTIDGHHPGLVAKVAAAVAAHTGQRRSRFMVPVDLRRHDPGRASTGNLSLPVFLDVTRAGAGAGEAWEDLHDRLLRALAERRELSGGVADRAAFRLPLRALVGVLRAGRRRYLCSSIISQLGRIDLATFSAGDFHASTVYSLPVHAPLAPMSIVATEPPGRTELVVAHHGAARDADALLDAVVEALSPAAVRDWVGNRTRQPLPAGQTVASQTVASQTVAGQTVAGQTVAGLFRRQVEAAPDAVALTGPQGTVTYAELDRRADVVAHELRGRGVGTGAVVGLLTDRTVEAMAALLGVLKAGAAYLPLDPRYPDDRIGYVLRDSRARLCLVTRDHAERATGCETVILEDLPTAGAPAARAHPGAGDLAYVIYTSGSSGRPKGVQVEHRSLVNYVTWATNRYAVDGSTRFALFTSLAFDLSGTSILLPLLAGGSIALVPDETNHATLRAVLEDSGANALKLTPAHLDLMGRLSLAPSGFRVLIVGGEQLKGSVAARARQMFGPGCRIVNEYGPTEATIGCVVHVFDPERDAAAAGVPIGVPVANTAVHLLDSERRFVRPGEIGEMYLTGAQLARGYLGRPDLDRERFVYLADGTRAYRTGDLARLTADGVLEYLGRTDDQVKIRGHRVEPGEIEAVLEECPHVQRAVVVARSHGGRADRVLCAYVVCDPSLREDALREDALREHVARRLPHYMVPGAFVAVAELPHTPNGKVDLRALPDPSGSATAGPADRRRDDVEEAVARIWARILEIDVDRIDPDADFHGLGGDSLSLIEMFAAVPAIVAGPAGEDRFMTELRPVIRNPTLAAVCRAVRRAGAS